MSGEDIVYRGVCIYQNPYTGEEKRIVGKAYTSKAPATMFKNKQSETKFYHPEYVYDGMYRQRVKSSRSDAERFPLVDAYVEVPTGWERYV